MCAELSHGQMIEDVKMHLFDLKKLIPVGFVGRAGGVIFTPEEVADKFEDFKGGL